MTTMLTDVSDGIAPITSSPITTSVIDSGAGEKAFVAEPEFRWT